jgi:hypothetical protein
MAKRYICEVFPDSNVESAAERLRAYLEAFQDELHIEVAYERRDGALVAIFWTEQADD